MKYSQSDPVAAMASLPGQSAITVIRSTGDQSLAILGGLFQGKVFVQNRLSRVIEEKINSLKQNPLQIQAAVEDRVEGANSILGIAAAGMLEVMFSKFCVGK